MTSNDSLRIRFYRWRRETRPQRLVSLLALIAVWPVAIVFRSIARRLAARSSPKRILVLHFAGLGDMLMLTPALTALQQHFPNTPLKLITRHGYVKDSFAHHPRLKQIELLPAYGDNWLMPRLESGSRAQLLIRTIWYYPDLILRNCFRGYDLGINFALSDFDRARGNALLCCLGVPHRLGSKGKHSDLLTHIARVDYSSTHRRQAYLDHLSPFRVKTNSERYEFAITGLDSMTIERALRYADVDATQKLVTMHPGGKVHVNSRRWPKENFIRVGKYLADTGLFHLVITGDGEDKAVCDEIARGIGQSASSFAGRLSISETAALLSRSELCITNDTGTLHLAEAMQVPKVVSIFGPTDPSLLVPDNERHVVFRATLPCSPCMGSIIDSKTERCPREIKEECLHLVTAEEVIAALRTQYERRALQAVN